MSRIRFTLMALTSLTAAWSVLAPASAAAQGSAALVRLLKGGKLPAERVPAIIETICDRGEAADLAFVFEQVCKTEGLAPAARLKGLNGLAKAARTRKIQPDVDANKLIELFNDDDAAVPLAAIRLAAAWKAVAAIDRLQAATTDESATDDLRQAALDALVQFGAEAAEPAIERLTVADGRLNWRVRGVAALAALDLERAARAANELLSSATPETDLAPLFSAFMARQGGALALANALVKKPPSIDAARLGLRALYAIGRSDADLTAALYAAAGIAAEPEPLKPDEVQSLVAEVAAKGDAARGERIFRRSDLNCFKCHALSGAGGNIGPDLSAVGSTSPVDYVVNSLTFPNLAIKEAFVTRIVQTVDGGVYQGIVVDRNETQLALKDAAGQRIEIPVVDIEEEAEGKSLMPDGLANLLTRSELVDLVRFVSELGKPGEYAIRTRATVQRWRMLAAPADALQGAPLDATLPGKLPVEPAAWRPAYAKVAGMLPWGELAGADQPIVFLQAEINVVEPGDVQLVLSATAGATAWWDDQPLEANAVVRAERGMHSLIVRIDPKQAAERELRALIEKPADSTAQFTIIGGP